MIKYFINADILDSDADALVNPVNCAGIMGKGLAKSFKERFPWCLKPYKNACSKKELVLGNPLLIKPPQECNLFNLGQPAIILFPTKNHWRDKSKIEWIEDGLVNLHGSYKTWGLSSIAMPKVGCGLGGLKWESVQLIMENLFVNETLILHIYA
jgi:O-acetyl-ADP-ribose deacetylase (regulator of RNase III)